MGAFDYNSLNPFSDVRLPKVRRPKQTGRHATLENVVDMLAILSDVDAVATRVVAMAAFSGLTKIGSSGPQNGKTFKTAKFTSSVQPGAQPRLSTEERQNPAKVLCPSSRCWRNILKHTATAIRVTAISS